MYSEILIQIEGLCYGSVTYTITHNNNGTRFRDPTLSDDNNTNAERNENEIDTDIYEYEVELLK